MRQTCGTDAGAESVCCALLWWQVAKDMAGMFELHGITKASLLAHSYGTFYVSCLLKLLPERVSTPKGPCTLCESCRQHCLLPISAHA
jgi:hypothetical protein